VYRDVVISLLQNFSVGDCCFGFLVFCGWWAVDEVGEENKEEERRGHIGEGERRDRRDTFARNCVRWKMQMVSGKK
jgi:hypothetical protein